MKSSSNLDRQVHEANLTALALQQRELGGPGCWETSMERDVGFPYDALHKSDKMLIYVVIVIYCAMFNAYIHDTHTYIYT
jgi:hypothetical protein